MAEVEQLGQITQGKPAQERERSKLDEAQINGLNLFLRFPPVPYGSPSKTALRNVPQGHDHVHEERATVEQRALEQERANHFCFRVAFFRYFNRETNGGVLS